MQNFLKKYNLQVYDSTGNEKTSDKYLLTNSLCQPPILILVISTTFLEVDVMLTFYYLLIIIEERLKSFLNYNNYVLYLYP